MKVYLDNCALNRPFDDQSQERIRLETEALMIIFSRLERKEWTWLGSQALEIEIEMTPDPGQRAQLQRVIDFVSESIAIGPKETERAQQLEAMGFIGFDAAHLACAESGKAKIETVTGEG